jgi:hypothetical protein
LGENRLLLTSIPCLVDEDVQMCDWTSGYIIRNGPSASSWDLGRAVNFPKSSTRLFVGKQLKFMAVQSPSKQTGEEFAKTFKRELLSEYNKSVFLYKM